MYISTVFIWCVMLLIGVIEARSAKMQAILTDIL